MGPRRAAGAPLAAGGEAAGGCRSQVQARCALALSPRALINRGKEVVCAGRYPCWSKGTLRTGWCTQRSQGWVPVFRLLWMWCDLECAAKETDWQGDARCCNQALSRAGCNPVYPSQKT